MAKQYQTDEIAVSIVCFAYNHEKYIRETFESLVNQITDFKYEIIVHEDVSTDNTRGIIEEYMQKYPELFVAVFQTENQYVKSPRLVEQAAYEKIRGKYCAFCEGDDYWTDRNKLMEQYAIMEKNPDCSICVHRVDCITAEGGAHPVSKPEASYGIREGVMAQDELAKALWLKGGYPFQTSSYFVRREVMNELVGLMHQGLQIALTGDIEILKTSLNQGNVYYIEKSMSRWRQGNAGSYTSGKKDWTDEQLQYEWAGGLTCDRAFDEYSGFRFHEYVIWFRIRNILGRCKSMEVLPGKLLKEYGVTFGEIMKYASWKHKVYYACVRLFPNLYLCLTKWKRKYL